MSACPVYLFKNFRHLRLQYSLLPFQGDQALLSTFNELGDSRFYFIRKRRLVFLNSALIHEQEDLCKRED